MTRRGVPDAPRGRSQPVAATARTTPRETTGATRPRTAATLSLCPQGCPQPEGWPADADATAGVTHDDHDDRWLVWRLHRNHAMRVRRCLSLLLLVGVASTVGAAKGPAAAGDAAQRLWLRVPRAHWPAAHGAW